MTDRDFADFDSIEPFIGYRWFSLTVTVNSDEAWQEVRKVGWHALSDGDMKKVSLASINGTTWTAGTPLRAQCRGAGVSGHSGHEAPAPTCRCGIYAWDSWENLFKQVQPPSPNLFVGGQVALWGRIRKGEWGFRGQRAYPQRLRIWYPARYEGTGYALVLRAPTKPVPSMDDYVRLGEALGERYSIPVEMERNLGRWKAAPKRIFASRSPMPLMQSTDPRT